ncbi:hypothetical protein [Polaromonas jejuensis]|uniref:Uncharacterized protein n=1 Tax=Polaromonas jejuensis TaxID=457502 RepID=A0ABW0Q6I3_9BURK
MLAKLPTSGLHSPWLARPIEPGAGGAELGHSDP